VDRVCCPGVEAKSITPWTQRGRLCIATAIPITPPSAGKRGMDSRRCSDGRHEAKGLSTLVLGTTPWMHAETPPTGGANKEL